MSRQVQGYCSMVVRAARYFSRASDRTLSRTERRMLERKHRNREKRKSRIEHSSNRIAGKKYRQMFNGEGFYSFFSNSKRLENLTESLIPRLPGRNVSFTHKSLWMALGFRLPLFMLIAYGITNENVSPYVIQGSLGPSMLPTIQFVGDIWLVETGAWHRALRWALRQLGQEKLAVDSMYEIGDMVIWEDTNTGKRSCKRIIGLEGDTVYRFGQYRNLYRNRADVGILWPKEENAKQIFGAFSGENEEYNVEGNGEISQTIIVPNQCVWLEGDCPLFSMDSRYGKVSLHYK